MIQPYITRDPCFRATRLLINRVTRLKTGIPSRRLRLANAPLSEWVRSVTSWGTDFLPQVFCPRPGTYLVSFGIVKVMHCVSVALSNQSQACRLAGHEPRPTIGVGCIRPRDELR